MRPLQNLYFPIKQEAGLAIIRIIVGGFLVFHGSEIFDNVKMKEYTTWDVFKGYTSPGLMVYLGKASELLTGWMLVLGFFTRIAALIIMFTFLYITFFVGHGKFWYEDQHPFLFVLLALVFFFVSPGRYSLDNVFFNKERN